MIPRRVLGALLVVLCSTWCGLTHKAWAQPAANDDPGPRIAARRSAIGVDSTLPALLSGVAIEAGQADGTATINFTQKQGNKSVVAKLSTPVAKDSNVADFASLDGLASDLSFSLAYTGFSAPKALGTQQGFQAAEQVYSNYKADSNEHDAEGLTRAVAVGCGFAEVSDPKKVLHSEVTEKVAGLLLTASETQRNCFVAQRERALDELDFASFGGKMIGSWAVSGEVARQPAAFFQADGTKGNKTNLPVALSAGYGWIGKNVRYSLSGRYESRFKDGENVTRCQPFAGGAESANLETCEQLPFASPVRTSALVTSGEIRWFFKKLAVSAVISYDFKEKVLGVQVPAYFVRNSNSDFTGGIRFGWRDDTHDFTTAVFVSKPLSLGD